MTSIDFKKLANSYSQSSPKSTPIAGASCVFCGGEGSHLFTTEEGYPLRSCCGTLLSWPYKNEDAYNQLYTKPGAYHLKEQVANGQASSFSRDQEHLIASRARLDLLLHYYPKASFLLDIGTGTGSFPATIAAGSSMLAQGCDPSQDIVEFAQSLGRRVWCGGWEDIPDGTKPNIITMYDVFEHLARPRECFRKLKTLLLPGGLLVVEMPEWYEGRPHNWKHIRPRQHICLYSLTAFIQLAQEENFQVESFFRPLRGALGKITFFLSHSISETPKSQGGLGGVG